tara:strand:- start:744 stop:1295 length:552 start_codon:yes stop_codon:yes gene_type:complete
MSLNMETINNSTILNHDNIDPPVLNSIFCNKSSSESDLESGVNSSNTSEILCRICLCPLESDVKYYCNCEGSTGIVHKHCLLKWLFESARTSCEICNYEFEIIKEYKFNRRIAYLFICILFWIGAFCAFMVLQYNEHYLLILTILCVVGFASIVYIKNTNDCYVLKSLDIKERSGSETSRLLN